MTTDNLTAVETLIDRAVRKCGSAYRLSKLTGVGQGALSGMIAGTRPIPPSLAAKLADIVGDDPLEALVLATIDKEKDEESRAMLRSIFSRRLAEAVRFELTEGMNPRRFSRPVP